MTPREFRNALCVLRSIDRYELVEEGVLARPEEGLLRDCPDWWEEFRDRPCEFFIRCDDEARNAIWRIIERRNTPIAKQGESA